MTFCLAISSKNDKKLILFEFSFFAKIWRFDHGHFMKTSQKVILLGLSFFVKIWHFAHG